MSTTEITSDVDEADVSTSDTSAPELATNTDDMERFFFNKNIFDEDHVEEVIEVEPPPPTFSEEELSTAKIQAFNQGKDAGSQQEVISREQHIAESIAVISKTVSALIDQEQMREQIYEREVIATFKSVFEKLFPLYEEKHGFNEMAVAIQKVLEGQRNQVEIVVTINPDVAEGIDALLKDKVTSALDVKFIVQQDETLDKHTCKLAWKDGGAIVDRTILSTEIQATIEQVLAGAPANVHDKEEIHAEEQDAAPTPQDTPPQNTPPESDNGTPENDTPPDATKEPLDE